MRRLFQSLLILLGCVHLCGGGLGFLQVMAWTGMAISYSAEAGVSEGLRQTFDGEHPCPLCHAIAAAENPENRSSSPLPNLPVSIERLAKEIIWLAEKSMPVAGAGSPVASTRFADPVVSASLAGTSPPVPPPRSAA
jgi:hypothetical protein